MLGVEGVRIEQVAKLLKGGSSAVLNGKSIEG
jgi:hypothetical protein